MATDGPTLSPTLSPTAAPSVPTVSPTASPTLSPTVSPTLTPTASPIFIDPVGELFVDRENRVGGLLIFVLALCAVCVVVITMEVLRRVASSKLGSKFLVAKADGNMARTASRGAGRNRMRSQRSFRSRRSQRHMSRHTSRARMDGGGGRSRSRRYLGRDDAHDQLYDDHSDSYAGYAPTRSAPAAAATNHQRTSTTSGAAGGSPSPYAHDPYATPAVSRAEYPAGRGGGHGGSTGYPYGGHNARTSAVDPVSNPLRASSPDTTRPYHQQLPPTSIGGGGGGAATSPDTVPYGGAAQARAAHENADESYGALPMPGASHGAGGAVNLPPPPQPISAEASRNPYAYQ